jgi:hypothetical protein
MGDSGTNQRIATNVRNWLHYDTLASSLYKQSMRARQVRDEFEAKVIQDLSARNQENTVIQINSGTIHIVEERTQRQLTVTGIEQLLHLYYQQKGGARDETKEIMSFIRKHRGYNIAKHLRKTGGIHAPPLPPPPGSGSGPGPMAGSMIGGGGGGVVGGGGGM